MKNHWPQNLMLVRHGQSAGNLAAEEAEKLGHSNIVIAAMRDMDVPLSPLGERQARAFGRWLANEPKQEWPEVILTSPYVRASATAALLLEELGERGKAIEVVADERLREREFGVIDRLTKKGIKEKYPEEYELHARLGKFYYRPPGGESWCDVILRLRSFLDSVTREHGGKRTLVTCHTVVVLCFRFLLEKMSEQKILEIDSASKMANCGFTNYVFDESLAPSGGMRLKRFNFVTPLEEAGETVTTQKDS